MLRLRQDDVPKSLTSLSSRRLALGLLSVLAAGAASGADRAPPLPVPRPRFDAPAAAPQGQAAPGTTGSTSSAVPAPVPATRNEEYPQGHDPFVRLNEYPREEQRVLLRRCASQWDRRKREGTVTGMIWRDFLEACIPNR